MDSAIETHMAQLRTLREAAAEVHSTHPVITRRIKEGRIESWRVGGVVLVRIDQVRQAIATDPASAGAPRTFAEVMAEHPRLNVQGAGAAPGVLGADLAAARHQLQADKHVVTEVLAWLSATLRPIKTFSAQVSAHRVAELAAVDLGRPVQTGHVLAAALMADYPVRRARGSFITFDPMIAVSAADFHAAELRQIYAPALSQAPTATDFLG